MLYCRLPFFLGLLFLEDTMVRQWMSWARSHCWNFTFSSLKCFPWSEVKSRIPTWYRRCSVVLHTIWYYGRSIVNWTGTICICYSETDCFSIWLNWSSLGQSIWLTGSLPYKIAGGLVSLGEEIYVVGLVHSFHFLPGILHIDFLKQYWKGCGERWLIFYFLSCFSWDCV